MEYITPREAYSHLFVMSQFFNRNIRVIKVRGYGFMIIFNIDTSGSRNFSLQTFKYNLTTHNFNVCRYNDLSSEFKVHVLPKIKNIGILKEYYGDSWNDLDELKIAATLIR